jgi:hypothetical protein
MTKTERYLMLCVAAHDRGAAKALAANLPELYARIRAAREVLLCKIVEERDAEKYRQERAEVLRQVAGSSRVAA